MAAFQSLAIHLFEIMETVSTQGLRHIDVVPLSYEYK
jgi:hypothetical protein